MPYQNSIIEIAKKLDTDLNQGLSKEESLARLKRQGKNALNKKKKETLLELLFDQIKDPMVIILIIGGCISLFLKEYIDSAIIFLVIGLNSIIGVIQEYKAEKAIDALEKLSEPKAFVIRDGFLQEIDSCDLVVGDVVVLEAGRYIPADIRLFQSHNLRVEESTLTGESEPVDKDANEIYDHEVSIAEQKNMVFMSTYVTYGKALGVVVRCGMDSEVGKIAKMLDETTEDMTPLQKRLAHLSKVLGIIAVVICAAMFMVAVIQGRNIFDMLLLAISLAVAAIPEGLPAVVTIVLALGVQVMSGHHAIIRKLHAVETLGSVNIICSDKTGTLTQNKMHVVSSYANGKLQEVNDELLKGYVLCNDACISNEEVLGEPTEKALLLFCEEKGFHKDVLDATYVRVNEIAFDSNRKKMTTIHQYKNEYVSYTKGAIEKIIYDCTHMLVDGKAVRMSAYDRNQILEIAKRVSADAQRVLALAKKKIKSPYEDEVESKLCFIGFVGLMDPVRPEAKEAIALCHEAGIHVVMITGDHPLTAFSIGQRLGIATNQQEVITGQQLDELSDDELNDIVCKSSVFARVTPEHKVRIVKAFKANNCVVAMSGDGVNDAPSLKQADIGIAMGLSGTDVCKQASDMILADDNFSTIVDAVKEGRGIYANIQKAILYLLSCNLGEIMTLFLAILCMPYVVSPLSAIQILWVNLITDAFPALALGVDPMEHSIMKQKPRELKESLFSHGGYAFTLLNGMFIGTITLVAFRYGLDTSELKAQSMAFMVLSMSQLFHAFNLRSRTSSIFKEGVFKNKWLVLTVFCSVILQLLVCQLPIFHVLLRTVSLNMLEWFIVIGLSVSVIGINEVSKWFA